MPRDCERDRDRDIERLWPREKDLDIALEEVREFCRPELWQSLAKTWWKLDDFGHGCYHKEDDRQ